MDYDALMAFATFAQYRNFTHAAQALFISQPALHKKVNKLAHELGVRLYVKTGRTLTLTPEGKRLAAHARQVASLSEDALAQIQETQTRGTVILASGPGAFLYLLGPLIKKARDGPYPLRLLSSNATLAAQAVREARAHVAIGVFESTQDLTLTPWRTVKQHVVMPRTHKLASAKSLVPEELADESLIIAPVGMPHRISTQQVLSQHHVPWHVAVEASGWDLMVRFVEYGMGITIINDFVPLPETLIGVPISGFPSVQYSIATHQNMSHEGAKWLLALALDEK